MFDNVPEFNGSSWCNISFLQIGNPQGQQGSVSYSCALNHVAVIDAIAGEVRFVGCGEKERKFSRQNFVLRGGSGGAEIGMLAVGF